MNVKVEYKAPAAIISALLYAINKKKSKVVFKLWKRIWITHHLEDA